MNPRTGECKICKGCDLYVTPPQGSPLVARPEPGPFAGELHARSEIRKILTALLDGTSLFAAERAAVERWRDRVETMTHEELYAVALRVCSALTNGMTVARPPFTEKLYRALSRHFSGVPAP